MKRSRLTLGLLAALAAGAAVCGTLSSPEPKAASAADEARSAATGEPDRKAQEKEFAKSMSGASLVGYFTNAGKEKEQGLHVETYRLGEVKKLPEGDLWQFEYRYGKDDSVIPLPPLEVKWAGDTPVITLTDMAIPGLGKFTARVLFYRGEYCGTWSGGDHGGTLFGKLVSADPPAEKAAKKKAE